LIQLEKSKKCWSKIVQLMMLQIFQLRLREWRKYWKSSKQMTLTKRKIMFLSNGYTCVIWLTLSQIKNIRKEEVKYQHNIANGIPRMIRKANRKGIIMEKLNEKALEE